jgi:hypothetical protein
VFKHIILGVWVCGVSLGSAFGVMQWQMQPAGENNEAPEEKKELVRLKTKMINIPLVHNGSVSGYVLTQFTFTADKEMAENANIMPDLFVVDEAFKVIYSEEAIDFNKLKKANVAMLATKIKENVNKRLGAKLVHDIFVRELNYLPREQFRGGTTESK